MDYTQIKRNMMGGRYRKALSGRHPGGPVAQGYKTDDDSRLIIDEDGAKVIRHAFKLLAHGKSTEAAATELNKLYPHPAKRGGESGWRGSHIRHWVSQPAYVGEGFTRNISPGPDQERVSVVVPAPAIIDRDLWEQAQKMHRGQIKSFWDTQRTPREDWKLYVLGARGKKGAARAFHVHEDGEEVPLWGSTATQRNGSKIRRYKCQASLPKRERGGFHVCPGFSVGYIKPNAKKPVKQTTLRAGHVEAQVLISLLDAASSPEVMRDMVRERDRRQVEANTHEETIAQCETKLADIQADRGQVEVLFRVQKKSEKWLLDEMAKLDTAEAETKAIMHRALDAQKSADQLDQMHETITAVFQTERDAKGYIKVKLPDGKTGKVFMPDAETPQGLRQYAEAVLDGRETDLPTIVRHAMGFLMEALDAKVYVMGTTDAEAPVIDLVLGAVSESNSLHRTSMTVLPTWMVSPR